jgi:hypothetical protein
MDPATLTALASIAGPLISAFASGGGGKGSTSSHFKPFNKQSLSSLQNILNGGGLQNNSLFGTGSSYLQNLLSNAPGAFSAFEAPFLQNFEQNIAPGIAERFAGSGTGAGALSSSGFQNSLAQAGRNLQTDLAGLRSGLQMQALPQALQYAQQPISNIYNAANAIPNQYYELPPSGNFLSSILPGLGQAIGNFDFSKIFSGGGNSYKPKYGLTQNYDTIFRNIGLPAQ